uniref:COX assembly mitochondrial protein n=1 Tax=Angiostrongylus costaricensis TaxID=334426 RepID=A0A0R3PCT8_ANGCS
LFFTEHRSLNTEHCKQAREDYLFCLDRELDQGKTEEQASQSCRASFRTFQSACPASWVGHFIRKHSFERYKRVLAQQGVNIADDNALGGGKKD